MLCLWDNEMAYMKAPRIVLHLIGAQYISIMCTSHPNIAYAAGEFPLVLLWLERLK